MDLTNDELMQKKKLSTTANKTIKNRKNSEKLKKELQEIKKLLKISDVAEEPSDLLASCKTPINSPGIEICQEEDAYWLFNEETLFLNEGFNIFGKDGEVPKEDLFRYLIAHHIAESILPDNEKCHSVSLYVLHLMSVHSDKYLVCACLDFLKCRRFEISAAEILPVLINFGSSSVVLIGSKFPIELPGSVKRNKGNGFPYEMVSKIPLHLDLLKKEPDVKLLLKALTRLTLYWKIRSSRLYSSLIRILSGRLVDGLGADDVASCLHWEEDINQLEIARVVLMLVSAALYTALIIRTIYFIFKSHVLKISDLLKVQDVIKVPKQIKRIRLTPLKVYCILELINGSLPSVTATAQQVGDINSALISFESDFFSVKEDNVQYI